MENRQNIVELFNKQYEPIIVDSEYMNYVYDDDPSPRIKIFILEEQIKKLKDENKNLKKRALPYGWTVEAVKTIKEENEDLEDKIEELEDDLHAVVVSLDSHKKSHKKLVEENEKLKLENQDLSIRAPYPVEYYDNIIDELKEENEKLKDCSYDEYCAIVCENKLIKEWVDMQSELHQLACMLK